MLQSPVDSWLRLYIFKNTLGLTFLISSLLSSSSDIHQLTAATSALLRAILSGLVFPIFSPRVHNRCYNLQRIINSSKLQFLFPWPPITSTSTPSFQFLYFPFSPHPLLIFFLPSSLLPPSLSLRLTRPPLWFRQRSQESDTENDKAIRRKWEQFRNDTDTRRMETYREDAFPSFQPCQPSPLSSSLFSLHFVKQSSGKIYGPLNSSVISNVNSTNPYWFSQNRVKSILAENAASLYYQFCRVQVHLCWLNY